MSRPKRVLLLGASGTIGRATLKALRAQDLEVVCLLRPGTQLNDDHGAEIRHVDLEDADAIRTEGLKGEAFDGILTCLASRTGAPSDAWAIDYGVNARVFEAAKATGLARIVVLSAICVQKPTLAFQEAKLKFEDEVIASGVPYAIVRPTAFFKSLSGQIARVEAGKPYLMFGDGHLTHCKPISDRDLATFLVDRLLDPKRQNRIFPIGGPGPAVSPKAMGDQLFALTGRPPKFRKVSPKILKLIQKGLRTAGWFSPSLMAKSHLAEIGHYYATESMLVWDAERQRYDVDATPETGQDHLFEYFERVLRGEEEVERGDHAVF